jgi:hypothetical protein
MSRAVQDRIHLSSSSHCDQGEAICSSETLVSIYKNTRRHDPEHHGQHLHRRENLKSETKNIILSHEIPRVNGPIGTQTL